MGGRFATALSAFIILAALVFAALVALRTGTGHLGSYDLTARMDDAAGLRVGTEVCISGLKVGRITRLSLDGKARHALVTLRVRDDLALPADSTVTVTTPVMSDVALTITPGHSTRTVAPGGRIAQWHAPARAPHFTGS